MPMNISPVDALRMSQAALDNAVADAQKVAADAEQVLAKARQQLQQFMLLRSATAALVQQDEQEQAAKAQQAQAQAAPPNA